MKFQISENDCQSDKGYAVQKMPKPFQNLGWILRTSLLLFFLLPPYILILVKLGGKSFLLPFELFMAAALGLCLILPHWMPAGTIALVLALGIFFICIFLITGIVCYVLRLALWLVRAFSLLNTMHKKD